MVGGLSILGGFGVKLGLDTDSYARGIINAESLNRIFGQSVTTFLSNPLLGVLDVVGKLTRGFARKSVELLADAEAMQRLSDTTGITVETLKTLEKQMELAHGSGDRAGQGMRAFATRLGQAKDRAKDAGDTFEFAGVQLDRSLSNEEAFRVMLDNLAATEDLALRTARAAAAFGEEAGPQLINTISGGSAELDQQIEKWTKLGHVISDGATDELARLNTVLGTVQQGFGGVVNSGVAAFLEGMANEITGTEDGIVEIFGMINTEFAPAMREAGEAVGSLIGDLNTLIERFDELITKVSNSPLGDAIQSNINVASQLKDGSFWNTPVGSVAQFVPAVAFSRAQTSFAGELGEWFFLGE